MVDEKNLSPEAADRIGEFVRMSGGLDLVEKLEQSDLNKSKTAVQGLEGMKTFLKYCQLLGSEKVVSFDLSLARGLDYYTGIIYEAVLLGKLIMPTLLSMIPVVHFKEIYTLY